ncbi:hypothetical protein KKG83_06490 [Candidatus Micrarchaeota archaeon]|nr:hypothetical protein [Candidatus Micrarchaeota archaeon]
MNKKAIIVILALLAFVLFSGCDGEKKLSDEEIEKKAKEYFYSIPDGDIVGFPMKTSDFVLVSSESTHTSKYKLSDWECDYCINFKERCSMTTEECKSYNGSINVYNFESKEEMPLGRSAWGKVVLRNNGEPIFYYWTGLEHFI